jgi:hypothetical protein
MKKFQFSAELRKELKENGKSWDDLLYRACLEAKQQEVKASVFAETLRKSGFRCGTGPARAAYKAVRDGKDKKGMVAAITAVKAKRKANTKANTANTEANTANTEANTANTEANTANTEANTANTEANTEANTLVGVLTNAVHAAKNGKLEVCETWLAKAQAMIDIAKIAEARKAQLQAEKIA